MRLPLDTAERPNIHPDAPAGAGGPGYFRYDLPPGPLGASPGPPATNLGITAATALRQATPATGDQNAGIWTEMAAALYNLNLLEHNKIALAKQGLTPADAAKKKLDEIRSGVIGVPTRVDFSGPKLFLRVVGPKNRAYGGEWWFEADLLDSLEEAFSRIYFRSADRRAALRDMLREFLAISTEWNEITEVWALELPKGETLVGYSGAGTPQKLFAGVPLTQKGNRMLVGKAKQIYLPVKNPLWVKIYERLL